MSFAIAAGIAAGAAGLYSAWKGSKSAKETNAQNVNFQQQTNAQNIALTREAWARDDNAVQRRAADLKAAGLSQTLAAGSPAGVSSPIRVQAPEVQDTYRDPQLAQNVMAAIQMQADYSQTRAQTTLLKQQAKLEGKQADLLDAQIENLRASAGSSRAGAAIDEYELALAERYGISTRNQSMVRDIAQFLAGFGKDGTMQSKAGKAIGKYLNNGGSEKLLRNVIRYTAPTVAIDMIERYVNQGTDRDPHDWEKYERQNAARRRAGVTNW